MTTADSRLGLLEQTLDVVNTNLRSLELLRARTELLVEIIDTLLSGGVLEVELRELFGRLGDAVLEATAGERRKRCQRRVAAGRAK